MVSNDASSYSEFPVMRTYQVRDLDNIPKIVEDISSHYIETNFLDGFCVRILLPRGKNLDSKARRLGVIIQGEILLSLRKKRVRPEIREIRYVHDEYNYGWLLLSPKIYDDHLVETGKHNRSRREH